MASDLRETCAPNFMVIGGARCGTTWLHKILSSHSSVFLPEVKEPDYFNRRLVKLPYEQFLKETFLHEPLRPLRGDMSVNYSMMTQSVVEKLHDILPNLKLVLILRNPVERSWSQIKLNRDIMAETWKKHRILGYGKRKPTAELDEGEIYRDLTHPRIHRRSNYEWIMNNWVNVYGQDAMHIELFESVSNEPRQLVERVLDHLGVADDPWEPPAEIESRVHGSNAQMTVPPFAKYWLSKQWIEPTRRLNQRLGGILDHWVESMEKGVQEGSPWEPKRWDKIRAWRSHRIYDCYELLRWNVVKHRLKQIRKGTW